jgi:hypothetical protein
MRATTMVCLRACKIHDTWAACVVATRGGKVALRGGCSVWGGGVGGDAAASACLLVEAGGSAVADSCAMYGNSLGAAVIAKGGRDVPIATTRPSPSPAPSLSLELPSGSGRDVVPTGSAPLSLELTGCDVHSSRVGVQADPGSYGESCGRPSRLTTSAWWTAAVALQYA